MSRHHVHLSADPETARTVGMRHGKPVVFAIAATTMSQDGYIFFCSDNGVWLIDHVPPEYLKLLEDKGYIPRFGPSKKFLTEH